VVCHSGTGLVPLVDGKLHHFSAGGLYNGLVLLIDDETRTYWDHITGEAVHGPLKGTRLETFPLQVTTVEAALGRNPGLTISQSKPGLLGKAMSWIGKNPFKTPGFFPPKFRGTMGAKDKRLPEMERGLGVVLEGRETFYPHSAISAGIVDDVNGRALRIAVDPADKVPFAEWVDNNERPMQLFTRWYGFAFTYPETTIFENR
jgi:hypothetical protein